MSENSVNWYNRFSYRYIKVSYYDKNILLYPVLLIYVWLSLLQKLCICKLFYVCSK